MNRDLLFLSHCVPNPPDKGEKIRCFHELNALATEYRIHLVCFSRPGEDHHVRELAGKCASIYFEPVSRWSLARAAFRFALGASVTTSFYGSRRMRNYVKQLARQVPLCATFAYCSSMAPYAPPEVPLLLDLVDVDSEKWLQYARTRWPGIVYGLEGKRMRRIERRFGRLAKRTYFTTQREEALFRSFAPDVATSYTENGVDLEYFDPQACGEDATLANRQYLVFVGVMDYFPNVDGCIWFGTKVFPEMRRAHPSLEFWIVGRNPAQPVQRLANIPGIVVTGGVPDVRPYLKSAAAVVAPLQIARGIQNKVLEALAMGKQVLASTPVCETFGALPVGVRHCASRDHYLAVAGGFGPDFDAEIRQAAMDRFSWTRNVAKIAADLREIADAQRPVY